MEHLESLIGKWLNDLSNTCIVIPCDSTEAWIVATYDETPDAEEIQQKSNGSITDRLIRQSVMESSTTFYISPQKHQINTYSVNRFIASSTLLSGTAKFIRMEQGPWKGRPSCQVTPTSQPACRT